jgi:transposase-like protein
MSILAKDYFSNEQAAFEHVEAVLWPNGPVCPHCGGMERVYDLGKTRIGLKKCGHCRKQYTVRVGTVFESSHIELYKWLQAIHLVCSSKKGISAHQLHRTLEVTYKTAWFLMHRIREAMRVGEFTPMGGAGGIVEIDETYIGKQDDVPYSFVKKQRSSVFKNAVLTLVERGGSARSFHIDGARVADIAPIVNAHIAREAKLMTDEATWYPAIAAPFAEHHTVNHAAKEYARGPVTTNTVESFYAIFKRGMKGVYQHCSEKHLHRYLAEFDFRYSNRIALGVDDQMRAEKALAGIKGKRLTYRASASTAAK